MFLLRLNQDASRFGAAQGKGRLPHAHRQRIATGLAAAQDRDGFACDKANLLQPILPMRCVFRCGNAQHGTGLPVFGLQQRDGGVGGGIGASGALHSRRLY